MDLILAGYRILLGIAVLALSSYAYYAYAQAIRRRIVKPIRITWIMLFVITAISLESQSEIGFGLALALTGARIVGAGTLMVLSIKYGKNDYHWSYPLVVLAVIGSLAVRIWIENSTIVVCCTALADLTATVPTIIGAWQEPETETPGPWFQDALAALLDALSVTRLAFGLLIYPLYLCGVCTTIAAIVLTRQPARLISITTRALNIRMRFIVSVASLTLVAQRHRSTLYLSHPIHSLHATQTGSSIPCEPRYSAYSAPSAAYSA